MEASLSAGSLAVGCSSSLLSSGTSSPPRRGPHDLVGERKGDFKGAAGDFTHFITPLMGPRQTTFALAAQLYGRTVPPVLRERDNRGVKTTGLRDKLRTTDFLMTSLGLLPQSPGEYSLEIQQPGGILGLQSSLMRTRGRKDTGQL